MANVGNLAVKIVADASQVQEGTAKAGKAVSSFADSAVGKFLGVKGAAADAAAAIAGIKSSAAGAFGGIKSYFDGSMFANAGGIYGVLKSGIGGVVSLAGSGVGAVSGFIDKVKEKYAELAPGIAEAYKESQRLGTTTDVVQGFGKLGIDELALRKFRLRDETGNLAEGVFKAADRIAALKSPIDQAHMAFDKFGKSGVQYLDQLKKGSEGLREMFARYRSMGLLTSDDEAGQVAAAQKATKRLGDMWQGFWTRTTVAIAPAVEQWASRFQSLEPVIAKLGERVGVLLGEGFKAVSTIVQTVALDILKLGDVFGFVQGKAGGMFGDLADWSDKVKEGMRSVAFMFGDLFDGFRQNIGPILQKLGDSMTLAQRFAMSGAWGIVIDANKKDASNDVGQAIKALGAMLGAADVVVGQTRAALMERFARQDAFDRLRGTGPRERMGGSFADGGAAYDPIAAMERNSKEAASVLARWKTEGTDRPEIDLAKKQIEATNRVKEAIDRLRDNKLGFDPRQARWFEDGVEKFGVIDT